MLCLFSFSNLQYKFSESAQKPRQGYNNDEKRQNLKRNIQEIDDGILSANIIIIIFMKYIKSFHSIMAIHTMQAPRHVSHRCKLLRIIRSVIV